MGKPDPWLLTREYREYSGQHRGSGLGLCRSFSFWRGLQRVQGGSIQKELMLHQFNVNLICWRLLDSPLTFWLLSQPFYLSGTLEIIFRSQGTPGKIGPSGVIGNMPLTLVMTYGKNATQFFFCTILWAINNKFMESPLLLHIRVPLLTSLYHFWGLKDLLLWMHWNPETAERTHRESSANFLCAGTVIFPAGFHPRLSDLLLGSSTTSLM